MRSKFKDMIFVKGGKYTPHFIDDVEHSPVSQSQLVCS